MLEIETKAIGIDVPSLRKSLRTRKAKFVGKFLLKRYVFNLSNKEGEDNYVRIRTDGKKSTLTYKFRKGNGLRNTTEIETGVEDFEKAAQIFSSFIKERYYQENLRESCVYKGANVDINTWSRIPPYVEVEGSSEGGIQLYKGARDRRKGHGQHKRGQALQVVWQGPSCDEECEVQVGRTTSPKSDIYYLQH